MKPRISRETLISSGIKAAELARQIGVSPRTVCKWYSGREVVPRNDSIFMKVLSVIDPQKAREMEPVLTASNKRLAFERRHSGMTTKENAFIFKS
jgi:uncharacterized protein YjcR